MIILSIENSYTSFWSRNFIDMYNLNILSRYSSNYRNASIDIHNVLLFY